MTKWKYYAVPIHVDATGHISVRVPKTWTEEQVKNFALDEFFADDNNTELGDAVEALEPTEITAEDWGEQKGEGKAAWVKKEDLE